MLQELIIIILSTILWLWLVYVVSEGKLIETLYVNSKRTHKKSQKTTHERRSEHDPETKKEKE